jgi:hypothetical protein
MCDWKTTNEVLSMRKQLQCLTSSATKSSQNDRVWNFSPHLASPTRSASYLALLILVSGSFSLAQCNDAESNNEAL